MMRASLNIDDSVLAEVMQVTGKNNRSEAIRMALDAFLKQQRKNRVLALRGKVEIENNWQKLRALEMMK